MSSYCYICVSSYCYTCVLILCDLIQKEDKGVTGRFKVTKFPTILVVKPGQKKPIKFEGKFTDIREIFEFLNKYQETFALENNAADEELALKKPWLSEAVPELTSISAQDICYGADAWCVVAAGKRGADGKLEKGLLDTLMASKGKHSSGSVKLSFMWIDADREVCSLSLALSRSLSLYALVVSLSHSLPLPTHNIASFCSCIE